MFTRLLAILALTFMVAACGYRGALYLPEDAPENPPRPEAQDSPLLSSKDVEPWIILNTVTASFVAEDVAVNDIANQHGSPTYIYSRATLE